MLSVWILTYLSRCGSLCVWKKPKAWRSSCWIVLLDIQPLPRLRAWSALPKYPTYDQHPEPSFCITTCGSLLYSVRRNFTQVFDDISAMALSILAISKEAMIKIKYKIEFLKQFTYKILRHNCRPTFFPSSNILTMILQHDLLDFLQNIGVVLKLVWCRLLEVWWKDDR